jgi:phosphinothricin acetyltransferase
MKTTLVVRPATLSDAQAIARIYNQGIEDRIATFETEPRTTEMVAAWLGANGGRFPTVVVEQEGVVIAWARASEYSTRPCYSGIAEFSVYVERSARGTGAGRTAMHGLIEACEARGFWKLLSRVFPENRASRALCVAAGFREVGLHQRHARLDGVWHDCILVERLLGEARESMQANQEDYGSRQDDPESRYSGDPSCSSGTIG